MKRTLTLALMSMMLTPAAAFAQTGTGSGSTTGSGTTPGTTAPGTTTPGEVAPAIIPPCLEGTNRAADGTMNCNPALSNQDGDGVLQAMEGTGERFELAVQWHPETGRDLGLFEGLVAAAGARSRS